MDDARPLPFAPERVAHRGAPRELPENTLPSFARALERGADAIELDVHATADGVVVVHHDPTLGRTVATAHHGRPIHTLAWAALRDLELMPGVTLPSLDEVLALVGRRARVYVEIKGERIERRVVETIAAHDTRCAVHSFDHAAIARCAALAPDVRRGILLEDYPADVASAMRAARALDVWPHHRLVDAPLVDAVHAAGGRVVVWTVNAPDVAARLRALGVDGLCTDDVRLLDQGTA